MNETDTTQEVTTPLPEGRPRVYAPWMIGVLVVFAVCEILFVTWGYYGIVVAVLGLIFAILLHAIRSCRVRGRICLGWFLSVLMAIVFVGMILFPAISFHREAARRMQCMNKLEQIGLGLQNFHAAKRRFPSAFIADEQGRKMHGWRVLILPYIEEGSWYRCCDRQEPWNSSKNQMIADGHFDTFRCPSLYDVSGQTKNRTDYVAVLGEDTFWRSDGTPRTVDEIKAGTNNTAILIEINDSDIPWNEPRDVDLADLLSSELSWSGTAVHTMLNPLYESLPCRHILFADGSVRFARGDMTPDQIRRMFSVTEPFDVETELPCAEPRPIVYRHVIFYVWLATLAMQFIYVFFFVKKASKPKVDSFLRKLVKNHG